MDPCAKPSKVYDLLCDHFQPRCVDLLKLIAINEIQPTLADFTLVVNDDNYLREMLNRFPSLSLSVLTASPITHPEDLIGRGRIFVNLKRGTLYTKVCLFKDANNGTHDSADSVHVVYKETTIGSLCCNEDSSDANEDDSEFDADVEQDKPGEPKDMTEGHYGRCFSEFKDKFFVLTPPSRSEFGARVKEVRACLLEITAPTVCPNCMNALDPNKHIIQGFRREMYDREKSMTKPERYAVNYQCPVCMTQLRHAAPRLGPEHFSH